MEKGSVKNGALTTGDLDKITGLLDKQFDARLAPPATKVDLHDLKTELKDYIQEGVRTVMDGIDSLEKSFTNKERVEKLAK